MNNIYGQMLRHVKIFTSHLPHTEVDVVHILSVTACRQAAGLFWVIHPSQFVTPKDLRMFVFSKDFPPWRTSI